MSKSSCFQLTIVRHGETEYNRKGIIQGQSDVTLSQVGEQQAALVAERLASERFHLVFSSDLSRAYKTAEVIVSRLKYPVDIEADSLLRERALGKAEDHSISELIAAARRSGLSVLDYTPPEGETHVQLRARAGLFFNKLIGECFSLAHSSPSPSPSPASPRTGELLTKYGSKANGVAVSAPSLHVLLVTHGGWIRCLMEYLKKDCPNVSLPKDALSISPNTGVTSLLVTCRGPVEESPSTSGNNEVRCTAVTSLCMHDGSHL